MRFILFLILLLLGGLAFMWQTDMIGEPTFETMENLEIISMRGNNVTLAGDAVFKNPNPVSCQLVSTDLTVYVNDVRVGKVNQTDESVIEAGGEFKVPVEVRFSPQKLLGEQGFLGGLLSAFTEKTMDVRYTGHITVEVLGIKMNVEVDDQEEVQISTR